VVEPTSIPMKKFFCMQSPGGSATEAPGGSPAAGQKPWPH
jgi:hypothetical protein